MTEPEDTATETDKLEDEAAEDDEVRPDGRSDPGDPWHGLNDFDEPSPAQNSSEP